MSDQVRRDALLKQCGNLLFLSERALGQVLAGDLLGFKETIDRRGKVINQIRKNGELSALPQDVKEGVRDGFLAVRKIDQEITRFLRREMKDNQDKTAALVSKAKALSAYDKVLPKPHSFDKAK